ncbi:MAG: PHP domain-containing protein [Firmicutes bacterium]|nr:PHP domain-containing protein [Bacillota bacterium]
MKDLHIKTNLSAGGQDSVEDILRKAQSEGLQTISITDHNTALAHFVLKHYNPKNLFKGTVVSGIEIDVCDKGLTFEILGYGFDVVPVQNWAYKTFATLDIRQAKLRDKLLALAEAKGFKLKKDWPWDARTEYAHFNVFNNIMATPGNLKLWNKPVPDGSEFYRLSTTDKDFVLYLDMGFLWVGLKSAIGVIQKNGGKAVLAHPYKYTTAVNVTGLLDRCRLAGVDGIEVYHPKHSPEQIKVLLEYCKKHKLLISGGSGYIRKAGEPAARFAKLGKEVTII